MSNDVTSGISNLPSGSTKGIEAYRQDLQKITSIKTYEMHVWTMFNEHWNLLAEHDRIVKPSGLL